MTVYDLAMVPVLEAQVKKFHLENTGILMERNQLAAEVQRLRAALERARDRETNPRSVAIIEAALRGGEGP